MKEIIKIFLEETIPDLLSWEYDLPYIKFVLDEDSLNYLQQCLSKEDMNYEKQLHSIQYLYKIKKESEEDNNNVYIPVHDINDFFNLLEKLIEEYQKRNNRTLKKSTHFIRSIWLRMSPSDIEDVESFLEKQLVFLKNDKILPEYEEYERIGEDKVLAYRIHQNEDWFETNQNIVLSIRKTNGDFFSSPIDYDFPSIHYALAKKSGRPTCFIYGIQNISGSKAEEIKEEIQPIRKQYRNKEVSPDFIIGMSLFLDYLFDIGITHIEVVPLQVFNYTYHEHLSKNIKDSFETYTEEDKKELEALYNTGDRSDKVLDYMHTKKMVSRFVDKQDQISQNKTERLLTIFQLLQEKTNTLEITSYPWIQSENLQIEVKDKMDILGQLNQKKRT